jgi:hypothetical protein
MSDQNESQVSGTWKWIVGIGVSCLIMTALVIYALGSYMFIKGKPQLAEALDHIVWLESRGLAAGDAALLGELNGLASQKETSLAAVTLLANSISGAVADHQVSVEEAKLLGQIRDFVQSRGGKVSYRELGAFNGGHPEIMKLQENQNLAAQVVQAKAERAKQRARGTGVTSQTQSR